MMRASSLIVLVVLMLAALPAGAAPRAQDAAALPAGFMGMVIRDPWYDFGTVQPNQPNQAFQDRMGELLDRAGVRWVRFDFHIPVGIGTPNEADAVAFEIAKNDYFVNTVAPRYGFKVLALLSFDLLQGYDPRGLNSTSYVNGSHYGGAVNQYMDSWLTRALTIADRYRANIAAYEVLNEENRLPQYTPGGPAGDAIDPAVTARLITKFYRFCKNVDPPNENHGCSAAAPIILGGLHPRGSTSGSFILSDVDYLKQVYTKDATTFTSFKSIYGYYPVDGIGYHPYPEEIQPALADTRINQRLPLIRAALQEVGDPYTQFWITEVGYNVAYYRNSPAGQEPFLRDVYTSLEARRLDNGGREVANVFWFKYEDFPPASGSNAQMWGIVRIHFEDGACPGGACYDPAGGPELIRPSFFAYRELAGLPVYRTFMPLMAR